MSLSRMVVMPATRTDELNPSRTESQSQATPHREPFAYNKVVSYLIQLRFGLFSRAFLIITAFMVLSLSVWGIVVVNTLEEHRANQVAERATSALNIAQKSIQYAAKENRLSLIIQLATPGDTQVYPREATDEFVPLGNSRYESLVNEQLSLLLPSADLLFASEINNEQGLWIGFQVEDELYWLLVKERQDLFPNLASEGLNWLFITLAIALFGSAISVRMLTKPLKQLATASKQLARGENPAPLPINKGPTEIVEVFSTFNQMASDLHANETDREVMLAGISHDLRTPLARLRLEIEMSGLCDETLSAIDNDMDQIDHCIAQLIEYARPTGEAPKEAINISKPIADLCERDRNYTESLGGTLNYSIQDNLCAYIKEINLIRVVGNLIENARRYGHSDDGSLTINVALYKHGNLIRIDVSDLGQGIPQKEIGRLMRPFARGNEARSNVSGAGLGLAISRRLLQPADGTIELLPNKPNGLLCRIELPKASNINNLLDKGS